MKNMSRHKRVEKPKVLIAPYLTPPGGGSAVGAWTIQALRAHYDLTVVTSDPVRLADVNAAFGTDLRPTDAQWRTTNTLLRWALQLPPIPLALLHLNLNMRAIRQILEKEHFDVVLSTMNEIDVGRPAIQYIHYPWAKYPRPDVDYRWYHQAAAVRLYRAFANYVSGYEEQRASSNLSFANSAWTASIFENWYGKPCEVVYPPVAGGFPEQPWETRDESFIIVGRISPEKELEKVIEILSRVRSRGHQIRLSIAGHADNPRYRQQIRHIAKPHEDWITFFENLERSELTSLIARHRYGIHGMTNEHFGIAPAELQLAGCICFVPDDGGQVEIVGSDERLVYHNVNDAADKICHVLSDERLRTDLRASINERTTMFTADRFMQQIRNKVEGFLTHDLVDTSRRVPNHQFE